MVDNRKNTPTLQNWFDGFKNLKSLGCSFAAFYGAEPLEEFEKLPDVINFAELNNIHTTVITSGIVDDLDKKLKILYNHGLRSITTSYDYVSTDSSSTLKTSKALEVINSFRSIGPVRDVAVVMTLTRANFRYLPDVIKVMSKENIWTFFDIIHPSRNQPGTKVKDTNKDLLFLKEDFPDLIQILNEVAIMKNSGDFLCHASKYFIGYLRSALISKIDYFKFWNCAHNSLLFPSWVTVDCDGTVKPCDDFFDPNQKIIKIWELYDNWYIFQDIWSKIVSSKCPGCLWNTHLDSHFIKEGSLPITDYIHGLEK